MDPQRKRYWIAILLLTVLFAAVAIPKRLEQKVCSRFAEPLYAHSLPEGAELVQQSSAKGKSNDFTAALILSTDLTEQELLQWFGDMEYPPAKEGQTVTLHAKRLDEDSLKALAKANLYQEGKTYWFVYIYSCK